MLKMMNIVEVVSKNRNSRAKCTEGVEVGDILLLTINYESNGWALMIDVSKYNGSGDINDPENYTYIAESSQGNFSKFYSSETSSSFTVKPRYPNWPSKGAIENGIKSDLENLRKGVREYSIGNTVIKLFKDALNSDPNVQVAAIDHTNDYSARIKEIVATALIQPKESIDDYAEIYRAEIMDVIHTYAKVHNVSLKYLGL